MSTVLRVVLILASLGTVIFMMRRIRQSKIQIEDTLFWVGFSALLLILSIFPIVAEWLAQLLGIASTVNFIFLFMIFVLLLKVFHLTIKLSQVETKMKTLAQKIAVSENLEEKEHQE